MSIRRKTELAFKGILDDAAISGVQVLTSQNAQTTVKAKSRVVIRAMGGAQVTPRSRNIREMVIVSVESQANQDRSTDSDPVDDHIERVRLVCAALNDIPGGLAAALSAQRSKPGVSPFYCSGIVPQGEYDDPPATEEAILRDSLAYVATVAETDST